MADDGGPQNRTELAFNRHQCDGNYSPDLLTSRAGDNIFSVIYRTFLKHYLLCHYEAFQRAHF